MFNLYSSRIKYITVDRMFLNWPRKKAQSIMNDSWNDALKKKYSHCGGSGIENVCVSVFYKLFHLLIHPPHFPPKNTSTPACANHITNRCKSIHFTNCQSTDKWSSIYLLYIQPTQGGWLYMYICWRKHSFYPHIFKWNHSDIHQQNISPSSPHIHFGIS